MESQFITYLIEKDYSERTIKSYLADVELFSIWFTQTNGRPLTAVMVTPTDIREYKQYQILHHLSASTVNRRLAAIRAYMAWAQGAGQIQADPAANITSLAEQESAPHWLERREQFALQRELERKVAAARTEAGKFKAARDLAMWFLLLNTGLRISEACRLQMGDIQISDRAGAVKVLGKGEKARTIPLNASARNAIREWVSVKPTGSTYLFISRNGSNLDPRSVENGFSDLGKRVGVELTPHRLRHTFAKSLINAGISLDKVAALLGHSSLNTTRIYTTPSQADLANAVNSLDG